MIKTKDFISSLSYLTKVRFRLYIDNENKEVKIKLRDLNEEVIIEEYFTVSEAFNKVENGSLTGENIDGLHIFRQIKLAMIRELPKYIYNIVNDLSSKDGISTESIITNLNMFKEYVNTQIIPRVVEEIINDKTFISKLIDEDKFDLSNQTDLYNLLKIKKNIKCDIYYEF